MREARNQLRSFMQVQVAERKAEIRGQDATNKSDAFTMLIKANEDESGKLQLDDQELVHAF